MAVRVRFAPSPTGHLHVGSVRTALFNWLLARHENGTFILRIEDTDRERSKPEYLEAVLEDLQWLGLSWDEGPFFQSERLSIYQAHADTLLKSGMAYPCFCTPEILAQKRALAEREKRPPGYDGTCRKLSPAESAKLTQEGGKPVLRFRISGEEPISVEDAVRGRVDFSSELFEDFVIVKSDGYPVYNFACAVDDHLMEISHVLRGEEHLSNTPRQLLIDRAFGWTPPVFGHLSVILDENRKKLSKREGATYLSEFRKAGFLPEALLNFLALLGWAPKENLEILPLAQIVRRFGLNGIGKSPAVFDGKKLEWMNGQYIKSLPPETLAELLTPFLKEAGFFEENNAGLLSRAALLFQERIKTLRQFTDEAGYFFKDPEKLDPQAEAKLLTPKALALLKECLPTLEKTPFNEPDLEAALRSFTESKSVKAAELIHPLRLLLTGRTVSPGIFQVMVLLGKEKTMARLKRQLTTR